MSGLCNPIRKEDVMLTQYSAAVIPARNNAPLLRRRKKDYSQERKKKTAQAQLSKYKHKLKSKSYFIFNNFNLERPEGPQAISAEILSLRGLAVLIFKLFREGAK